MLTIEEIERAAMRNEELKDLPRSSEIAAYISFRGLYHDLRAGIIEKEQAKAEKKRIVQLYTALSQSESICSENMRRWNKAEHLMAEVEKSDTDCPTCKAAREIIRILDGRKNASELLDKNKNSVVVAALEKVHEE